MSEFNYNQAVLGFENSEIWDTVIYILKQNIDTETADALNVNTTGEARIHACGRANALTDILILLQDERHNALQSRKNEIM
jgi:hypothetical protein